MAISVLLVESHAMVASAIEAVLTDPARRWRVTVSRTVAQAREELRSGHHEVVVAAHRLADGTAFDLLPLPASVPALLAVAPGGEAFAARGMREGFSDYFIADERGGYLLTLPAQIQGALEKVRLSRLLADSAARAELALESADLGLWERSLKTGKAALSARWTEILGFDRPGFEPDAQAWRQAVHPDDWAALQQSVADYLAGRTPIYEHEYRMRHKQGHWFWVQSRGKVIEHDAQGAPLRMIGTYMDVTERHQAHEALAFKRAQLDALIHTLPDCVWMQDLDGACLACNRAFEQRFGVAEAALAGCSDAQLFGPALAGCLREADATALASGRPARSEVWIEDAAGGPRALFEVSKIPMRDAEGRPMGLLGVARDVTERHAAAQVLARQNRLLQAISQAQGRFIGAEPRAAFEAILGELLSLTGSRYGFVGELQHEADSPCLRLQAIASPAWDEAARAACVAQVDAGLVLGGLDTRYGPGWAGTVPWAVQSLGEALRGGGLPHAPGGLQAFLGIPVQAGEERVGVVGLAREDGTYATAEVEFLQPLLATLAQLVQARRADEQRRLAQAQLEQTGQLLAQKTRALELTLDSMTQGISNVDAEGRIRIYNRRYLELLDLPESLLSQQPSVEEVVRLQTERGDFGDDFGLIDSDARSYVAAEYAAHGNLLRVPDIYLRRTRMGRVIEIKTLPSSTGGRVRTFTDVTAYFDAQEALRQSEARWRSLTELSSDWFWEQDASFRFVRMDGNLESETGIASDDHLGRHRWDIPALNLTDADWAAHRRRLEAHEVFLDFEMQRPTIDGVMHWVSVSGAPIFDARGLFTGYRGIGRNITPRKLAEAEIRRLAFFDELTGLPNRRLLLDRLSQALGASARSQRCGALLFMDLDNFKDLNDTLGHDRGDRLLEQVGRRLVGCVRSCDTVARLGGDEFVLILEQLDGDSVLAAAQVEAVTQKMLQSLNQPYVIDGSEHHSTPSVGIALFSGPATPVEELLKRADLAMYQAKAAGRNTLCFFDPDMQQAVTARSALEADLRQGLLRGELGLHYQPVVDAAGRWLGVEALARWAHPLRGMVPPGQFITLAEQTGLILPLGRHLLRVACEQLVAWAAEPRTAALTIALNVSAREFRQPEFSAQVLEVLRATGADPRRLKLELTESLLLQDVEDVIVKMERLQAHGVGFSLDDFGTGYSSLSYLKRLPLDQLKIDQSFVRDVLTDPNDAAIACTIIGLAQSLGLSVVAEGVETAGQREFLERNGCRAFQGYLFGRPVPVAQLLIP